MAKKAAAKKDRLFGGIDIGGTKILAMIVDENGAVVSTAKKKTKAQASSGTLSIRTSSRSRAAVIVCRRCRRSVSAVAIWFFRTSFSARNWWTRATTCSILVSSAASSLFMARTIEG